MKKSDCIRIIIESAEKYKQNLLDKNILIVYQSAPHKSDVMEIVFRDVNFLHLTGVEFTKGNEMSPADFFSCCINHKLPENSICLKEDGTTELKLKILPLVLVPNLSSKMVGNYKGGRIRLVTDRLAGGLTGSIGFIKESEWYHPNTVLKGDIRDNIDRPRRILAVFRKDIASEKYEECTYIAKKVELKKLAIPEPFNYLSEEREE